MMNSTEVYPLRWSTVLAMQLLLVHNPIKYHQKWQKAITETIFKPLVSK